MQTVTSNGVATFDEISAADEPRAGGKAFNCARLQRAGFPVPDGLVVLSTAADDDLEALAGHPWFDTVPAGSVFAVRSSGIGEDGVGESFAGIHQTLLNVARADVPAAVATCRASAHTAQALEYRRGRHLAVDAVPMGSLVQRMVQPIAAGVAFTVNPVTGVETELVINAAFGLGEALVSGQIDPDEFVIDKHTREVRFRRIGDKGETAGAAFASLTPDQLRELAALLVRIEQHYGAPQDVEWCHDGARFWIAQSRPVTARSAAAEATEWTRPRSLPDTAVWARIDSWFAEGPDYMQPVLLLGGVLVHEAPVWKACARVGFPFEQLVYPQLAVGERSVSASQAYDLVALADMARREPAAAAYLRTGEPDLASIRSALRGTEFLAGFERFLDAYGHRGRYEYDWSLPRYREDPAPLLHAIRAHLEDASAGRGGRSAADAERHAAGAWRAFERRLSRWQRWTVLPAVRRSIRQIKRYYVWREQVRSDLVRVLSVLRDWHLVLAERFVDRGWLDDRDDYFLLRHPEIAALLAGQRAPGTLRTLVADRTAERERQRSIQMPLLMRAPDLPALLRTSGVTAGADSGSDLTGQPVSGGCVEADVVVVRDPGDFSRMTRGAILVAPATDPSWTPLFTLASGLIVEVGGVLSHASTIAREYGLPALANVRQATRRLRTGERVRLDADAGVVRRLGAASEAPDVSRDDREGR